jgi:peptidoglycan/xylan/chitin deacetylase (PgdA/CDA1 family)
MRRNQQLKQSLKKPLICAYYGATLPLRILRNARLFAAGKAPVLVFFYHRIADHLSVPWSHTNAEFQRQMRWLKARCDMVTMAEAQRRIRAGSNDRLAAHITFDDGYAENCDQAIPFLIEENIPTTYFVSTWYAMEQQAFPHDLKLGFRLSPNTVEQLRAMADAGIEVAPHTRTHPDMGRLDDLEQLRDEFVGAEKDLEDMLGRRMRYFAFPFGMPCNMHPAVFHLAKERGYEAVCSAYGDYNFPDDDAFHIRRIHADDMIRLRNWGTIDPRKQWRKITYDYQSYVPELSVAEAAVA